VPNLERAYGLKASEIASNPDINPQGSAIHGALAKHIGLDATTVWAAATSGRGAIQVHLLACMLARQWSAAQAIPIWSELIAARKAQLVIVLNSDQFHIGNLMASKIEIGLEKIAEWDSSTRAVSPHSYKYENTLTINASSGFKQQIRPSLFSRRNSCSLSTILIEA
jgi:hypothetical protein